eukprot:757774-Hanusia_phi.AAC.2
MVSEGTKIPPGILQQSGGDADRQVHHLESESEERENELDGRTQHERNDDAGGVRNAESKVKEEEAERRKRRRGTKRRGERKERDEDKTICTLPLGSLVTSAPLREGSSEGRDDTKRSRGRRGRDRGGRRARGRRFLNDHLQISSAPGILLQSLNSVWSREMLLPCETG